LALAAPTPIASGSLTDLRARLQAFDVPGKLGRSRREIPFNAAQWTWERADIIICGTPEIPHDPSTEIVIASRSPRLV
jgi:hypothetical protein